MASSAAASSTNVAAHPASRMSPAMCTSPVVRCGSTTAKESLGRCRGSGAARQPGVWRPGSANALYRGAHVSLLDRHEDAGTVTRRAVPSVTQVGRKADGFAFRVWLDHQLSNGIEY